MQGYNRNLKRWARAVRGTWKYGLLLRTSCHLTATEAGQFMTKVLRTITSAQLLVAAFAGTSSSNRLNLSLLG